MEIQIEAIEKLIFCARYSREIAIERWRSLSGQKAVLDPDGRTFVRIAGERLREACYATA